MTTTYIFRLETNSHAILYLSSDENPDNKVRIVSNQELESNGTVLQGDTE